MEAVVIGGPFRHTCHPALSGKICFCRLAEPEPLCFRFRQPCQSHRGQPPHSQQPWRDGLSPTSIAVLSAFFQSTTELWQPSNGMPTPAIAPLVKFSRGIGVRQVRLTCGLVLFAYLVSHFLNHALGIVSPEALAAGAIYHTTFWQYLPIAVIFYSAAIVHMSLGIWSLYERREFRWRSIEPLQLVLGLCIPVMIISHIIGIRLSQTLFDTEKLYPQVLYVNWVASSGRLWLMLAVINVAWVHGCIGLYLWLRLKPLFKATAPFWFACAVLLPALAMLGFYQGGRTVAQQSQSQQWQADNLTPPHVDTEPNQQFLDQVVTYFLTGYLALLGLMIVGRGHGC
jgi:adenylate cyclase